MTDPVVIAAAVTATATIVAAVVGELVRRHREHQATRLALDRVHYELTRNGGGSMKDTVDLIQTDVREIRKTQGKQGERIAALEAQARG